MRRSDNRAALTDEVARFQAEVQRLALAAAHQIIQQEIDRRLAKLPPARPRAPRPARSDIAAAPVATVPAANPAAPVAPAEDNIAGMSATEILAEEARAAASASVAATAPSAQTARDQPPDRPAGRKRVPWTREAIVNELATWMLSGTSIDATFVTRHGPPGLVAASRRIFGRFDAALNVAALHLSRLYPDGPPARTTG